MSTIREQIVAAAVAAIATGRPSGVPAPVRSRVDSPTADLLPVLSIYQGEEAVEPMRDPRGGRPVRGPVVRRRLTLYAEVLTKAGSGTEPDKAADPILAWITEAVASAGCFGGLAIDPADEQGTTFSYERAETAFCRSTMAFTVAYHTRADNAQLAT